MKRIRLLLALAALAALAAVIAACAKPPSRLSIDPPTSLPPRWTAADASTQAPLDEWWKSFGDPSLNSAVSAVLQKNHDLAAAAARVESAAAQARIAGADLQPQVSASLNGSRRRQNFVGFPIPGASRGVLTTISTSLGVSLDVSWEADLWGRLGDGVRSAVADLTAVQGDAEALRQSLAAQTAKVWLAAAELEEQIRLSRQTLENFQGSSERIRRRYQAGLTPSLELRLSLTNINDTEALILQRQRQLQATLRQMEILEGRYPSAETTPPDRLPQLPPVPPAGLPSELVSRRPDLAAAEWRLTALDARLAAARKQLYPRLSLGVANGTQGQSIRDIFDPDRYVWSLVGNLLQPVFQGGRLRAQVALQQAEAHRLSSEFASSLLTALGEVETALAAESFLSLQEAQLEAVTQQSRAALRLAEDQYGRGLQDYLTVLEAQRRLFNAEVQRVGVRRLLLENRIDLHLALGGGFRAVPTAGNPPSTSPTEKERRP